MTKINNYSLNSQFSKKYRDLLFIFHATIADGRVPKYFDGENHHERVCQTKLKIDLQLEYHLGMLSGIEEKVVQWPEDNRPYERFYCETESCTNPGRVTPGWMRTSEAEYLTYAFEVLGLGLDIYFIDFQKLKKWFWSQLEQHPNCFHPHRNPDQNQTQGRLVPIKLVTRIIPTQRYRVTFDGVCQQVGFDAVLLPPQGEAA
jgi:hypothetical protein